MSNRSKTILLLLVDILVLFLTLTMVVYLRKAGHPSPRYLERHFELFSYIFPFWILMYFIEGLYTLKTYNPNNLAISIIRSTIFAAVVSIIIIYLVPTKLNSVAPKTNLVLISLIAFPAIYFWRRSFFKYFSKSSRLRDTMLIGSLETQELVLDEMKRKPHLGYRVVSAITSEEAAKGVSFENVQLVAIERKTTHDNNVYNKIFSLLGTGTDVIDLAKFAENISGKIPLQAIDESWFIEYCGHQESRSYDLFKSFVDRLISIILLVALVPVMIVLFPILLLVHGRPIFFKQVRVGLNNKNFTILKLRTMVVDAEKNGAQWAKPGDARVTPLGKFLRKSRLDELPQLINIIRGDMSLIGPRPERPEIIEKQLAPNIPYFKLRHLVKPGVTGWAQVTFRYGFSQADSKEKLQYDLFYVKNRSAWLDLLVFFKTIKTVLTGAGQ